MEQKAPKKKFSEMFEENPKKVVISICVAAILSVCIIIAFYFAVSRYEGFFAAVDKFNLIIQPFVIGFAMAFLMNPIMKVMEKPLNKKFLKNSKNPNRTKKVVRVITSIIALIILLAIIILCIVLIVPDTVAAIKDLMGTLPEKVGMLLDGINNFTGYRFDARISDIKQSELSAVMKDTFGWIFNYFNLGDKS